MIQVSKRDFNGSITQCRIHDVLHDLAIEKAREDNFLMTFSKLEDVQNCSQMRRLAIHDTESSGELMSSATSNLRSLLCSGPTPNISQFMRLKVLSYLGFRNWEPNKFGRLCQFRYFDIYNSVVHSEDINYFGKFIGGMRFLQTLELGFHSALDDWDLPDCVWHIKTLRHVLLPPWNLGPPPSVDLKNLQTLLGVRARESWEAQGLPKLPNVKNLKIHSPNQVQWDTIITLLGTMKHLISLVIFCDVPLGINDMRCFSFHDRLQNLSLMNDVIETYRNQIALDVGMLPKCLVTLALWNIEFREDPIPVLEKLENLRFLHLSRSYELLQLCCSTRGFGQLEELQLRYLKKLGEWKIEEGAMPMLKKLEVCNCPVLRVPLGLQYLTVLQELTWVEDPTSETRKNEIRSICNHVPSVII